MEEVVVVADVHTECLQPQSTNSDMEEVVVVANVHTECLQSQSTNSNMEEMVGQNTLEAARLIREDQGHHEAEVSCGGEADLQQHFKGCQKNPGHTHFIPIQDFKLDHLPSGYRDKVIVDWIRAEADLTCRLSVKCISKRRPKFFPGSQESYPFYDSREKNGMRVGTGWVADVQKYRKKENKNCECEECSGAFPHARERKIWGKVFIYTACHLVHNNEEARHTTCYFFYDRSTSYISDFPTLTGLKVEEKGIVEDMCMMTCATHDMDLVDKLVKMCDRRLELFEKVRDKYWLDQWKHANAPGVSYVTDPTPGHVVVISHPHGCSKQISVGEWTQRQTHGETQKCEDNNTGLKVEVVSTSYEYNAATCPGSSGAPVIRLLEKGKVGWWWLLYSHPHSKGEAGNNNFSGSMKELVAFPPTPSDRMSTLNRVFTVLTLVLFFPMVLAQPVFDTVNGIKTHYQWVIPCLSVIVGFFFCFLPLCRQQRAINFLAMIYSFLLFLQYLVPLVIEWEFYDLSSQVGTGVLLVFILLFTFLNYIFIANCQTSYKLQRTLRRITRITKTTTVPASSPTTTTTPTSSAATTTTPITRSLATITTSSSTTTPS